jgi:hypothetical protein
MDGSDSDDVLLACRLPSRFFHQIDALSRSAGRGRDEVVRDLLGEALRARAVERSVMAALDEPQLAEIIPFPPQR